MGIFISYYSVHMQLYLWCKMIKLFYATCRTIIINIVLEYKWDVKEFDVCPSKSSTIKSIVLFTFDLQGVNYFLEDYYC